MNLMEAKETVLKEAFGEKGLVVSLRCANDPSLKTLENLFQALGVVANESGSWQSIDRKLACALYLLSFHAAGLIEARKGKCPEEVSDTMPLIYEKIDEIFGVYE